MVHCPVCGQAAPIWLGPAPTGCLDDGAQKHCQQAIDRAHGEAMRRKIAPDAFDETGKIKPGQIIRVVEAMHAAGLNAWSGRQVVALTQQAPGSGEGEA